jgi:hypothetical protein
MEITTAMKITKEIISEDDYWIIGKIYHDDMFSTDCMKLKKMFLPPTVTWVRTTLTKPVRPTNPSPEYLEAIKKWPIKAEYKDTYYEGLK